MKITAVRTLSLSRKHEPERQWSTATVLVPKADAAIIIIETDEGVLGIGEASAYGTPPRIAERVQELSGLLIGQDPHHVDIPLPDPQTRADAIPLAGLDCALWDLSGKLQGKSVARLLAGDEVELPDRIRLYASAGVSYDWDQRPEQVVDEAVQWAQEGFTAFKMRLGTHWDWSGVTVDRFIDLARQVHAAAGAQMDLMLDGNCRLSEEQALKIGQALDEMDWYWFEEPIPGADRQGYARLNEALNIPVTGGESLCDWSQIQPYVADGAYAIVQVDAGVAGLTACRQIATQAWQEYGVPHCPHNWHNGLMTWAHAHLVAAHPSAHVRGERDLRLQASGRAPSGSWHGMLELNRRQGPLQWEILAQAGRIEEGHLLLPDAPGLGCTLAEDLETRFPYIDCPWGITQER